MICRACQIRDRRLSGEAAFLAGIAYAFQHNNEALRRDICLEHRKVLTLAADAAKGAIPVQDRRVAENGPAADE